MSYKIFLNIFQQFGTQALQQQPMIQGQQQVRPNYPTQGGYSVTVCQVSEIVLLSLHSMCDPLQRCTV